MSISLQPHMFSSDTAEQLHPSFPQQPPIHQPSSERMGSLGRQNPQRPAPLSGPVSTPPTSTTSRRANGTELIQLHYYIITCHWVEAFIQSDLNQCIKTSMRGHLGVEYMGKSEDWAAELLVGGRPLYHSPPSATATIQTPGDWSLDRPVCSTTFKRLCLIILRQWKPGAQLSQNQPLEERVPGWEWDELSYGLEMRSILATGVGTITSVGSPFINSNYYNMLKRRSIHIKST